MYSKVAIVFFACAFFLGIGSAIEAPASIKESYGFGLIGGEVFDSNGNGISNVSIELENGKRTFTNANGFYLIDNVRYGKHTAIVIANGYKTIIREIFVTDKPKLTNFIMEEGEGKIIIKEREVKGEILQLSFLTLIAAFFTIPAIFFVITQKYRLAIAAGFFSIFSYGFIIGSVLSLSAVVLLLLISKEEKFVVEPLQKVKKLKKKKH
ncbi:MAG: carboxypeptidase-like regulatory domain-containing protein [Candidatus Thermoplasmatota archaeon]